MTAAAASRALTAAACCCHRSAALSPEELAHAEDLLWQHLEGTEEATQRMSQTRPHGWRRGEPATWATGHGERQGSSNAYLMTSTTHCASMWYVRSRPGVLAAFAAAFGTPELVSLFDVMGLNLPTSSGNRDALRVAATRTALGKFGAEQPMHAHAGHWYEGCTGPQFYGIVPLFEMNRKTGATALV
jgi:hypothetical protein